MRLPTHFQRPSPALVIAVIALFAAIGGGSAVAAKMVAKNTVTSLSIKKNAVLSRHIRDGQVQVSDISKGALAKLKVTGPTGAAGTNGTNGAPGTPGPSNAYSVTRNVDQGIQASGLGVLGNQYVKLDIPAAGNYILIGKINVRNETGAAGVANVQCTLIAGPDVSGTTDVSESTLGPDTGANDRATVTLTVAHTYAAAGDARIMCTAGGPSLPVAFQGKITAIKVAELVKTTV